MLCQKCHRNLATVRYAEVVDGQVSDQHLCAACMAALQDQGFKLDGPAPTVHWPARDDESAEDVKLQASCSSCGMALNDMLRLDRAGCPDCYAQFWDVLAPRLGNLHPGLRHHGKSTHIDDRRLKLREDLQSKRSLLRRALESEDYEEAAHLRDEINCLETGLAVSESGAD